MTTRYSLFTFRAPADYAPSASTFDVWATSDGFQAAGTFIHIDLPH